MPDQPFPPVDLHMHTWFSPCATQESALSSVEAYAAEAVRLGLDTIAITDHFALPGPALPDWYDGLGPDIIDQVARFAAGLSDGVTVLIGCEAEMLAPGRVTIDAAFARTLDLVILAASHLHFPEIGPPVGSPPTVVAAALMDFFAAAVAIPYVDIVAHPFVIPHEPFGPPASYLSLITDADFRPLASIAAANSIAFEINGSMASQDDYRRLMPRFFHVAREQGVKFSLGSDAHSVKDMARLENARSFAVELGLRRDDFIHPVRRV